MTNKRRLHPADPDRARAQAETNYIMYVFGKTKPKNPRIAAARTKELARVLKVLEELRDLDDMRDIELPPMPAYPVVMRKTIYTDNVRPAPLPTRAEIEAHRRRLLGPKKP